MSQHTRSQSFSSAGSASSFAALPKDLLDSTPSSTMGDQDGRVDPSGTPNPDISAVVRRHHTLGAAGGRLARLERYRQRTIMDLRMDGGEDREGPIIAGDIDGGDGGGVVGKWKRSSASQNNLDNDDIDLLLSPTRSHLRPPMSPSSPTSPTGSSSSNFALVSTSNLHRHTSLPTRRSTARTLWSSRRYGGTDVSPDERAEDEVEMDWGANSGVAGEEEDLGREEHEEGMEWRKGPRRVPGDGLDDVSLVISPALFGFIGLGCLVYRSQYPPQELGPLNSSPLPEPFPFLPLSPAPGHIVFRARHFSCVMWAEAFPSSSLSDSCP